MFLNTFGHQYDTEYAKKIEELKARYQKEGS